MSTHRKTQPDLHAWYLSLKKDKRAALAKKLRMSVNHLIKNMSVGAQWDVERAVILEKESGVKRELIRPDLDWKLICSEPSSSSSPAC